jgi:benzoyl-CoA-dihydrodiol lyase
VAGIEAAGAAWWPLAMARELDDAILSMRTNELDIGTWLLKTEGDAAAVLAMDATLMAHEALAGARDHRPAAPHLQPPRCVLAQPVRADRAGLLLCRQLPSWRWPATAATCWRCPTTSARRPRSPWRDQLRPAPDGHRPEPPAAPLLRRSAGTRRRARQAGKPLDADAAFAARPGHRRPDDIDWADEVRIAIEERAAMSPDALTGLEANLRFNGPENMVTASSAA